MSVSRSRGPGPVPLESVLSMVLDLRATDRMTGKRATQAGPTPHLSLAANEPLSLRSHLYTHQTLRNTNGSHPSHDIKSHLCSQTKTDVTGVPAATMLRHLDLRPRRSPELSRPEGTSRPAQKQHVTGVHIGMSILTYVYIYIYIQSYVYIYRVYIHTYIYMVPPSDLPFVVVFNTFSKGSAPKMTKFHKIKIFQSTTAYVTVSIPKLPKLNTHHLPIPKTPKNSENSKNSEN